MNIVDWKHDKPVVRMTKRELETLERAAKIGRQMTSISTMQSLGESLLGAVLDITGSQHRQTETETETD